MEKTFTLQEFIEWVYNNSKYKITNIGSKNGKYFWIKYTDVVLPQANVIYECGKPIDCPHSKC